MNVCERVCVCECECKVRLLVGVRVCLCSQMREQDIEMDRGTEKIERTDCEEDEREG